MDVKGLSQRLDDLTLVGGLIVTLLGEIVTSLTVGHQRVVIYDQAGENPLVATVEDGLKVTPKLPEVVKVEVTNKVDVDVKNEVDVNVKTNPVHVHVDNTVPVEIPNPLPVEVQNIVTVTGDVGVTGNVTAEVTGNVTAEVTGAVVVSGDVAVTGTVAAVCTGIVGILGSVAVKGDPLDLVPVKVHVDNFPNVYDIVQPVQVVGSTLASSYPEIIVTTSAPLSVHDSGEVNVVVTNGAPVAVDVWNGLHPGYALLPVLSEPSGTQNVEVVNTLLPVTVSNVPLNVSFANPQHVIVDNTTAPQHVIVDDAVLVYNINPISVTGTVNTHNQLRSVQDDTWRDQMGYVAANYSWDDGGNPVTLNAQGTFGALPLSATCVTAEDRASTAVIITGHGATIGPTEALRATQTL